MLVFDDSTGLRLVTQSDHARLARQILSLWRLDDLQTEPWRDTLLKATSEHDNGWREADAAPAVSSDTGWPCNFLEIPAIERQRIWRLGIDRFAHAEPRVAFLILLHALRLHQDRLDLPEWHAFARFLDDRKKDLSEACEPDADGLRTAYEFLWLADALSLGACGALAERRLSFKNYKIELRAGRLQIEPFPFAGRSTLTVPCRVIPQDRYRGESDLGTALAEARWGSFTVGIEPITAP